MIWGPLKSLLVAALLVPAAHAEEPSIQVDSSVEANYAWTFPSPPGEVEPSLGFLSQTRQLRLTDATISLNSDWGRVGFHLEGGDGDFYRLAMAEDSWKGPNQYISQAYVFGRPLAACRFASKPESSSQALARSWPRAIGISIHPDP